jgi:DNA polymerase III sliding clamp (beta) subunit (PCNA family)
MYYVVDIYSKKYYGPFKNCKKAKRAVRIISELSGSDLLLEIGTNFIVVGQEEFVFPYTNFQKSDFEKIKEDYDRNFISEERYAV